MIRLGIIEVLVHATYDDWIVEGVSHNFITKTWWGDSFSEGRGDYDGGLVVVTVVLLIVGP